MTGLSLERALLDAGITITPDYQTELLRDGKSQYLIYREFFFPGKSRKWACFGDWKYDTFGSWFEDSHPLNQEELKEVEAQVKVLREKERLDKEANWLVVAEEAKLLLQESFDRGTTDYLDRKKLTLIGGARISHDPRFGINVVVPMEDFDGNIWNVQRIYNQGGKYYLPGGRISGLYFPLGGVPSAPPDVIMIVEGYATGATVFKANLMEFSVDPQRLLTKMVAVAFFANNLKAVGTCLRQKYPDAKIVFAADNDQFTIIGNVRKNVGVIKALEAAQPIGATVCYPTFPEELLKLKPVPTDFNDLHVLVSLSEVKNQIENFKETPMLVEAAVVASTNGKQKKPSERSVAEVLLKEFEGNLVKYEQDIFLYTGTHWELQTSNALDEIKKRLSNMVPQYGIRDVDNAFRYFKMHLPTPPKGVNLYQPNSTAANFLNGTLHVNRLTFKSEFKPHNRADYLTSVLRFNYPDASQREIRNEEFDGMLNRIWEGDEDLEDKKRVYAQALGACLISAFPQFFIFVGGSGTGKSTIILIAHRLVHEENTCNVSPHHFEGFGMESMIGKLVNFDTDISTHKAISDDVLKKVRDRVPVTIRRKGIKDIKAPLPAIHFFGANKMPKSFEGDSRTFDERFTVIRTDKFKVGNGSRDVNYPETVFTASPIGIINFALDGLEDLLASRGHYHKPASAIAEMESWNEDSDPMGQFLKELKEGEIHDDKNKVLTGEDMEIERIKLWETYKNWFFVDRGFTPKIGKKHFYTRLRDEKYREKTINGVKYFCGVKLSESDNSQF